MGLILLMTETLWIHWFLIGSPLAGWFIGVSAVTAQSPQKTVLISPEMKQSSPTCRLRLRYFLWDSGSACGPSSLHLQTQANKQIRSYLIQQLLWPH